MDVNALFEEAALPSAAGSDSADLEEMPPRLARNQSLLRFSGDSMTAWLYLMPPAEGESQYTEQEIKDFMLQKGVLFGHHKSNIAAICRKGIYCREIVVARGTEASDGENGRFEYHFTIEAKTPEILEDGTVDYTAVNKIVNVKPGDKLATYLPSRPGTDGSNVRGNAIKAKPAKDLPALRGAAISRRDTEDTYFAEKEGKVELRDGKLDIQSTHEVFGDVDQTVGKIEFYGDVVINGSVESGVVIRAGRNIEIRGSVEAASLFAGGDIILQRGIQGQQRAKASARGSVFAKFIEQTIVTAGADVVADSIMNSRINAEGKVILSGKRGMLVGGYTHALLGIDAVTLGNEAETRTVVHAGCEADVIDKSNNIKKREVQIRRSLDELKAELEDLTQKASLYGDKMQKMLDVTAAKIYPQEKELREELAVLQDEQNELQILLQKGRGANIKVDGNIYRGTVICVAQLQMPIENNTSFMNYTAQGGLIVSNVVIH